MRCENAWSIGAANIGFKADWSLGSVQSAVPGPREGLPLRSQVNQAQRRRTFLVGQYQGVIARDHRAAALLSLR